MIVKNGSTDITTYFILRDSTNHLPKTDVTVTDIDLYYVTERAAISVKADATALAAADSAHSDNKAFNVGQGFYRIDWPDIWSGGIGTKVYLAVVCTGVDTAFLEVELSPATNVDAFGGTAGTFAGGRPEVNTSHIAGSAVSTSAAQIGVNVIQLSGDATAADNAEAFFDGTGYAGTNNTIPTVTNMVTANVIQISGDSVAADNLESYCDGTTPIPANATQLSGDATAADNAEAFFDGTGYAGTNNTIPTVTAITNVNAIADALLDRSAGIETGLTPRQFARLLAALLLSKASGLESGTETYRDYNDSKDRIVATVAAGARNPTTRDAT